MKPINAKPAPTVFWVLEVDGHRQDFDNHLDAINAFQQAQGSAVTLYRAEVVLVVLATKP